MQTSNMPGAQESQHSPYITLQPVSVDGADISNNTMVQEGVNLQQAVMQSNNNTEINSEAKIKTIINHQNNFYTLSQRTVEGNS